MTPIRVVVGLDQASCSGWGVKFVGSSGIVAHGLAKNARERAHVVSRTIIAAADPKAVLVVYEDHSGMSLSRKAQYDYEKDEAPERNTATILGMGDSRGRWLEQYELAGVPLTHFIGVEPITWKRAVLGKHAARLGRDASKAFAMQWASARMGEPITDDNEAEAIAITEWGALQGLAVFSGKAFVKRVKARAVRKGWKPAEQIPLGRDALGAPDRAEASEGARRAQR